MDLIIGGAFQGKLEYAMKRYGLTDADVCDLALGAPVPGKRCYRHLEALSRREDVTPYLPLFRDAVVITREASCPWTGRSGRGGSATACWCSGWPVRRRT